MNKHPTVADLVRSLDAEMFDTVRRDMILYKTRVMLVEQQKEIDQLKSEVEQLRLDKKALTNSEILDEFCVTPGIHQFISAFKAGVRFAEKHHKIGVNN